MKNIHKDKTTYDFFFLRERRLLQEVGSGGEGQESLNTQKENSDLRTQKELKHLRDIIDGEEGSDIINEQEIINESKEQFEETLKSIIRSAPRFFGEFSEEKTMSHFLENSQDLVRGRLLDSSGNSVKNISKEDIGVHADEVSAYGELLWESLTLGAESENGKKAIKFIEQKWDMIDFSGDGNINGAQKEKQGIAWMEMFKKIGLLPTTYEDVEGNEASIGFVPENVLLRYITQYIEEGGSINTFEKKEKNIADFIAEDIGEKEPSWWDKFSGNKNKENRQSAEALNFYSLYRQNGVEVNMDGKVQESNKQFGVHAGVEVVVDDRDEKFLGETEATEAGTEITTNGYNILSSSFAFNSSENEDGESKVDLSEWSSDVERQSAALLLGADNLEAIGISVTAPEYNTEDWVMTYETIDGKVYASLHNNAVEQNITILVNGEGEILVQKVEAGKVVVRKYKKPVKNKENKLVFKLEQQVIHSLDTEEGNKIEQFLGKLGANRVVDKATLTAIKGDKSGIRVRVGQYVGIKPTKNTEVGLFANVNDTGETAVGIAAKAKLPFGASLEARQAIGAEGPDAKLNIINTEHVKIGASARNGFKMNLSPVSLEKWEKTEEKLVEAIMSKANEKDFQKFAYETLGAGKDATTEAELQEDMVEAATVYVLNTQLEEIANDFSVQFNIGIDSIYNNLIGVITPTLVRNSVEWNAKPSTEITRVFEDMQYVGENFSAYDKLVNLPDVPKENISFSAESVLPGVDVSGIVDSEGNVSIPSNLRLVEVKSLYNERNSTVDAKIVVQPVAREYDKQDIENNTTTEDRKVLETIMQELLEKPDSKKELLRMDTAATNERAWNAVNAAHANGNISNESFLFLSEQYDETGGDVLSGLSDIVFVEMDNRHIDATDEQVIKRILTKERANPDHILPTIQTANEMFGIPQASITNVLNTMSNNISPESLQTKPYTIPSDMQLLVHGLGNKANLLEMSKGQTVNAIGAPIHFEHAGQQYIILFNKGCNGNFIIGREKPEPVVQEKQGIVASPTVERAIGSLSLSVEFVTQGPWRIVEKPVEVEPGKVETLLIRFKIPEDVVQHHAAGTITTGRPSTAAEALQIIQYRPNDSYLQQAIDSAVANGVSGADHTLNPSERNDDGSYKYPDVHEYTQEYLTDMMKRGFITFENGNAEQFWSAEEIEANTLQAQGELEKDAQKDVGNILEDSQNPADIATALENAGYRGVSVEFQD